MRKFFSAKLHLRESNTSKAKDVSNKRQSNKRQMSSVVLLPVSLLPHSPLTIQATILERSDRYTFFLVPIPRLLCIIRIRLAASELNKPHKIPTRWYDGVPGSL